MHNRDNANQWKILVIQTAFIGDVILATSILEKIHATFPGATLDFLLRKGNEGLFHNHPFLNDILIWDKKKEKYKGLVKIVQKIRAQKYDLVLNLQRFATTGIITALSGGKRKHGFGKNPLSLFFTYKAQHQMGGDNSPHEIERNHQLIQSLTGPGTAMPRLYPTPNDYRVVPEGDYYCIAPTSVWFTKQLPLERWRDAVNLLDSGCRVFLLGGKDDKGACEWIVENTSHTGVENLAGKLSFLQSAALMSRAKMNFVNDSAPMHMASAMNAPVTAVFCSTIPAFGFGPLSSNSRVVEVDAYLPCKPCGLHGHSRCPEGHFRCGEVNVMDIIASM
jgi:ADP-heptose:LPS heptosyltransferase